MIRRRVSDTKAHKQRRKQEAAARDAAAFLFVKMAEGGQLAPADITAHAALFPLWEENTPHEVGCLRRCPLCNDVFRCIDPPPVSERARNSRIPPSEAPRFWERVDPAAECAVEGSDDL